MLVFMQRQVTVGTMISCLGCHVRRHEKYFHLIGSRSLSFQFFFSFSFLLPSSPFSLPFPLLLNLFLSQLASFPPSLFPFPLPCYLFLSLPTTLFPSPSLLPFSPPSLPLYFLSSLPPLFYPSPHTLIPTSNSPHLLHPPPSFRLLHTLNVGYLPTLTATRCTYIDREWVLPSSFVTRGS